LCSLEQAQNFKPNQKQYIADQTLPSSKLLHEDKNYLYTYKVTNSEDNVSSLVPLIITNICPEKNKNSPTK